MSETLSSEIPRTFGNEISAVLRKGTVAELNENFKFSVKLFPTFSAIVTFTFQNGIGYDCNWR
jgi:hypothetical protein